MKVEELVGKTIAKAKIRGIVDEDGENYSDTPYLDLEFSNGDKVTVVAYFGGTDNCEGEYTRYISLRKFGWSVNDEY